MGRNDGDPAGAERADGAGGHSGDEAVSEQRASEILGVSSKTLRNWRWQGRCPPHLKYGGRNGPVRYVVSELLAWRDAHRRGRE